MPCKALKDVNGSTFLALQVWKIFAPRFLYEAVFSAAADVAIIIACTAFGYALR